MAIAQLPSLDDSETQPSRRLLYSGICRKTMPAGLTLFPGSNYSPLMDLFPISAPIFFAPCAAAKMGGLRRFTRNAQGSARLPQIPRPGDTLFPQ